MRAKSFDGFCPFGPSIRGGLDPSDLRLVTRVNGDVKQDSSTSDLIFSVPVLIEFITRYMTLEPGDIVSTGTPSGVGNLSPGDKVEIEIEGVGVLSNPVIGDDDEVRHEQRDVGAAGPADARASALPVRAHRRAQARGAEQGRRSHRSRHRRSGPADAAAHRGRAAARRGATAATTAIPSYSGHGRAAQRRGRLLRSRAGASTLDPAQRGARPHRIEGGHRALPARLRRSGRPGAGAGPGLSGVRGRRRGSAAGACTSCRCGARTAFCPTWPPSRPRWRARPRSSGSTIRTTRPRPPRRCRSTSDLVAWAREHDVIVASDNAYADVYFDEADAPPSILSVPGASDVAIEFYSLSKTYNMTGWRAAFACGNADLVRGLGQVKTNVDSGVFEAVQRAAIAALSGDQSLRGADARGLPRAARRPVRRSGRGRVRRADPEGHASTRWWPRRRRTRRWSSPRGCSARRTSWRTPATGFGAVRRGLRAPDPVRSGGAPRRGGRAHVQDEAVM